MNRFVVFLVLMLIFVRCTPGIINGENLSTQELDYLTQLGLLEENEPVMVFSSSLKFRISGNFYTDRRIASYWQYDKSPKDNYIRSAKYQDIDTISLNYGDGFTKSAALVVGLKDGSSFNVYFDCEKKELEKIYQNVKSYIP